MALIYKRSTGSTFILPAELCGLIAQSSTLSRQDLHTLCSVSRAFRDETERFLYIDISLNGVRAIRSWARAVHRRPNLSIKTKRLIVRMPRQMDMEAEDLGWVVKGLRTCDTLEDLWVLQEEYGCSASGGRCSPSKSARRRTRRDRIDREGDSVQRWILEGHSFKLKSFVNDYFQAHLLTSFLKSQPDIEFLVLRGAGYNPISPTGGVMTLTDIPFANLRVLDTTATMVQKFSVPCTFIRNLQRLQVEMVNTTDLEELMTVSAITRFASTLRSLSIVRRDAVRGSDMAALVTWVVAQLPALKFLKISDFTIRRNTYPTFIMPFHITNPGVETLILRPAMWIHESDDPNVEEEVLENVYMEMRHPAGRRGAALRMLGELDSLKCIGFVGQTNGLHCFSKSEQGIIREFEKDINIYDWIIA